MRRPWAAAATKQYSFKGRSCYNCLHALTLSPRPSKTLAAHRSYVCITPGGGKGSDLVLTYPSADPSSLKEYFGMMMEEDRRCVDEG